MSANLDYLVRKLQETLGNDFSVTKDTMQKNGVPRECVLVSVADSPCGTSMVFYTDTINQALKDFGLDGAVKQIAKKCREQAESGLFSADLGSRYSSLAWEDVKGGITMKAVNESLAENGTDAIFFVWHRLPIVFFASIGNLGAGCRQPYAVQVSVSMAKSWGVGTKELMQAALENSDSKPILKPIEDILRIPVKDIPDLPRLYILTNSTSYGFTCVVQPDALEKIGERIGSFFILPSSVQEAILISDIDRDRVEDVRSMVFDANRSNVVGVEEFLSDLVWFYDAETKQVIDL